ncbi:MAG: peroxiredoxin-like family protein [Bacteroidales bacterium]|jgi:peroxiredoxin|nr:peroxiredoxin-like family protein [Bacteroidales bacterium]
MERKTVKECNGLLVGDKIKDFKAIDQNGNSIQFSELLKRGKVVIVFYRGQWCPICMPHLRTMQKGLLEVENKGASILIITPEKQENIQKTMLKTSITIPIIYDENYKIMEAFDVAFLPTKGLRVIYNTLLRADLKNAQSDDSQTLPVPATFIIDTDSAVKWRHFDRDYKKRSKINDILENL